MTLKPRKKFSKKLRHRLLTKVVFQTTLRKKYPYSELFMSAFYRMRTEYGELRSISPYSVRMQENE